MTEAEVENQDTNNEEPESQDGGVKGPGNRAEKKARKIMLKSGVKQIKEASRVTIKRPKGVLFVIEPAEVYKGGDAYIVFGEAKAEDFAAAAQSGAAERFKQMLQQQAATAATSSGSESASADDDSSEDADGAKFEEKDIELIMTQGKVSRAKAIQTLKSTDGDIINAIMQLAT